MPEVLPAWQDGQLQAGGSGINIAHHSLVGGSEARQVILAADRVAVRDLVTTLQVIMIMFRRLSRHSRCVDSGWGELRFWDRVSISHQSAFSSGWVKSWSIGQRLIWSFLQYCEVFFFFFLSYRHADMQLPMIYDLLSVWNSMRLFVLNIPLRKLQLTCNL